MSRRSAKHFVDKAGPRFRRSRTGRRDRGNTSQARRNGNGTPPMQHVLFDHARTARIGLPEAVFCQGKPPHVVKDLLREFRRGSGRPVLFTRLEPAVFSSFEEDITGAVDYDPISRTAFGDTLPAVERGAVAVISAGTADAFVAWEAARTLRYLGIRHTLFEDNGVAGIWRLSERMDSIAGHEVIIIVAGLDAALASVMGGLSPRPMFAVPTSVGYGMADHGRSALSSMLVSCAPGIGVLNIDNGYGAACAAARIINLLQGGTSDDL
jgi:NCAIR mutase (PurE)-related protein